MISQKNKKKQKEMIKKVGHKENIIELLKKNELGLTYKVLLRKYEGEFNRKLCNDIKNGYYYLRELVKKGLVKTYIPEDREGKIIAYKLTEKGLTGEPNDLEKLKGIVKDLIIKKSISEKQEQELVEICQL